MDTTALQDGLPREMIPEGLVAAASSVDPNASLRTLLIEHHIAEGRAFCRRTVAVYALWERLYGAEERALLTVPDGGIELGEMMARRRRLSHRLTDAVATVAQALRIGPAAADHAVDCAIGFIERLPLVFALVDSGVLAQSHARELLARSRCLREEAVGEFDRLMVELMTADRCQVWSLPALRERADRVILGIDPEAAEQRRKAAEDDRTVTFRPAEDGMAKAYALLTAHEAVALCTRIDDIAETVCDGDPRTVAQRRADGLCTLVAGFRTLGCRCVNPQCRWRAQVAHHAPDADGVVVRYRTLITVVAADTTLDADADADTDTDTDADDDDGDGAPTTGRAEEGGAPAGAAGAGPEAAERPGYLPGHGVITAGQVRDIAAREDAVRRPFGTTTSAPPEGATTETASSEMMPLEEASADLTAEHAPAVPPRRAAIDFALRPRAAAGRCRSASGSTTRAAGGPRPAERSRSEGGPRDVTDPGSDIAGDPSRPCAAPWPVPAMSEPTDAAGPARNAPTHFTPPQSTPARVTTAKGSAGYRPSADQKRYLLMLYPRCCFPGCTRPARYCQWDHSREYDHLDPGRGGQTTVDNEQPLCLAHHELKTVGTWLDTRLPDGRILWTSTVGGVEVVVDPRGVAADLFPELARVRWVVDPEALRRRPRSRSRATRLQREHDRREALREENRRRREENRRADPDVGGSRLEEHLLFKLVLHDSMKRADRERYAHLLTRGVLPDNRESASSQQSPQPPPPPEDPPPF